MKKVYIYKVNFLVEDDIENCELQNEIDTLVEYISLQLAAKKVSYVSTQLNDIHENPNFGQCVNCGTWTSDSRENEFVSEFSNGAVIKGNWKCDLCLPEEHENHF